MKICGYCGNEYDEKEIKCPQCGATMLKHIKSSESAAEEYARLKEELNAKRKNRSIILAVISVIVVLAIILAISIVVGFINDPQRAVSKESKALLKQAEQQVDDGNYSEALDTLDKIDINWDNYEKTNAVRLAAVKGELKTKVTEYEATGNYQAIISLINDNVANVNADSEVKIAYENAIQNYKADVVSAVEEFVTAGDYESARSALSVAENLIGEDIEIHEKLKEINQLAVMEVILSFEAEENYEGAIVYLDQQSNIVSGSAELQSKLSIYKEKYRENVISNAAIVYETDGYEASLAVLNSALNILPSDIALYNVKERYEQAAPIDLTNLDAINKGEYVEVGIATTEYFAVDNSEYYTDVSGNVYSPYGIHCFSAHARNIDDGVSLRSITYCLNQNFDLLTGTMYRPYVSLSCDFDWSSNGSLQVYGDGVLLCEESISQSTYDVINLRVNVTGVRELTLIFRGSWREKDDGDMWTSYYHYWHPKFCVADLAVAKQP